ncbi:TPA_asm: coat protein [ssRNA phage Zoerhiza.1_14]|uniref:Coat protein n=2 Tax=Leviviricetes TaxID=2842243 RepID=A0A8S5L3V6_9VIRU|nr:coat protein [ssRNA phage Zoerhiza.1_14]QDH88992.1 MAG: hypothetical protein H1Rhizo25845_000002 [Leviviridae sp.]DAD52063.1 TPA_asm: coat protein [ssRNA phage Zoerhiza.1_14]
MALSDPQSITVNGVASSLPRTGSGPAEGSFTSSDGSLQLTARHQYGRRTRRTIRLTQKKIVPDPLVPATNMPASVSAYLVIDHPPTGFSVAELKYVSDALVAYLAAASGGKVSQLLGGES